MKPKKVRKLKEFVNLEDLGFKGLCDLIKGYYEELNGEVNPIVQSRKLILIKDHSVKFITRPGELPTRITAYMTINQITVDVVYISEILKSLGADRGFFAPAIRGFVLGIIVHELSHVDQDVCAYPNTATGNRDYEWSNEMHARHYINTHMDKLCSIFGDIDMKWGDTCTYMDANNLRKVKNGKYIPVKSMVNKFISEFKYAFQINPVKICDDGYNISIFINNRFRGYDTGMYIPLDIILSEHTRESIAYINDILSFMANEVYIGYEWFIKLRKERKDNDIIILELFAESASKEEQDYSMEMAVDKSTFKDFKKYMD